MDATQAKDSLGTPIDGQMPPFPVVTICGSMRFKKYIDKKAEELSRAGCIVLLPLVTFTPEEQILNKQKHMLDQMHFQKIRMSDMIHVVMVNGYTGESTKREIQYARELGMRINTSNISDRSFK